uniref:Uncharacterized protein n=1 Tax=Arundo donax TaxID=35708 RepID=A0A0A9ATL5_ARUDO
MATSQQPAQRRH